MIIFLLSVPALVLFAFMFMQQKSFGQQPKDQRLSKIEKSPNYNGGVFHNREETPVMVDASFGKMARLMLAKHPNTRPEDTIPTVKPDFGKIPNDNTEIIWLGHSSYLIKTEGLALLIDPILSKRASPVQWTGVTSFPGSMVCNASDLPHIDVLISTHDHYDHLDYKTIEQLRLKTDKFLAPLGVGQHLEHWGVASSSITELDWWESCQIAPNITMVATPARHFSGRGFKRNQTLWASFVLITPKHRIFIGGDSGYGSHFAEIGTKYGPFDIAILESGQYGKYWPYIHSTPEQTVQEAVDLKAKVLLPVHWGRFKLSVHPWTEPITRVLAKARELQVKTTTPRIGESVRIDAFYPEEKWWMAESRKL